jgi:hypothetical protein
MAIGFSRSNVPGKLIIGNNSRAYPLLRPAVFLQIKRGLRLLLAGLETCSIFPKKCFRTRWPTTRSSAGRSVPHSDLRIYQEWARAVLSREFSKPRSNVTQFLDQILLTATTKCAAHFSTVIESTCIVLVLASNVPITPTFLPINFSGVF